MTQTNSIIAGQEATTCPSCGIENRTDFCPACGEYQHPERFSFGKVIADVPNAVVNFERGLPYSIRSLAVHPGATVKEYLGGARSRHYRPLNFVFLVGGLYTLLFSLADIQGVMAPINEQTASKWEVFIQEQSLQYQAFLILFQLPFFSLVSWLLFRKRGFFYGEHLIGNAYMVGEISIFQLVMFPFYAWMNNSVGVDILNFVYLLFMMSYAFFMYYDWFYNRKGFNEAWLCVLAVVLNIIVVMVSVEPLMIVIYKIKTFLFGE